jgi:hypothetical protein
MSQSFPDVLVSPETILLRAGCIYKKTINLALAISMNIAPAVIEKAPLGVNNSG